LKTTESHRIAGIASVGVIIFAGLFFAVNYFSDQLFFSLLFSLPVLFFISFMLINWLIREFIDNKIKPIYKTIHSFKPNSSSAIGEQEDLFTRVNDEVGNWMTGRIKEIQELRDLEKYRKEFLGNVSHELKTPIFNIQGYVLTLIDGGMDDPNINLLYLKRTEKSIDRMISIIEDLESISKLESGELELHKESFLLYNLLTDVVDSLEIRGREKNIKLQFGKNTARDTLVFADKQRIYQVLMNLLINSINYGKKGGATSIRFYDMDNLVLIEIKDDGLGISQHDLPRIFERFYRADKSRSREQGGTGLGLAIVKHLIEAHKQTINVSSRLGVGTSFTFTLEKSI